MRPACLDGALTQDSDGIAREAAGALRADTARTIDRLGLAGKDAAGIRAIVDQGFA